MGAKFCISEALAAMLITIPVQAEPGLRSQPIEAIAVQSQVAGEVVAVNPETRLLTLRNSAGRFEVLRVPPEVQRLDRVRIGNRVTLTKTTVAVLELQRGRDAGAMGVIGNTDVQRAPGTRPAGTLTDTLTIYGQITAVDRRAGTVTVRGARDTQTFELANKQLVANVKVGDGVVVRIRDEISGEVTFN
jgi:hypothetical protein